MDPTALHPWQAPELGLGPVRLVTLAQAREAALANRRLARSGGDPMASRRQSVPTFEQAAAKVVALYRPNWKSAKHARQWMTTLRHYAYPKIGHKRVDWITSADIMAVLLPIWNEKPPTAQRVRQRIGTVMKWAIAQGYRMDNPAGAALGAALPKQGGIQRYHRVPLSDRAREILAEARENTVPAEWVFPSAAGRPLWDLDLSGLLRELGIAAVPHGFRSSFRDWAAECTDAPHAVMEAALSHLVPNKVEAAYARSDLFERRRVLMEQWAGFLGASRQPAAEDPPV